MIGNDALTQTLSGTFSLTFTKIPKVYAFFSGFDFKNTGGSDPTYAGFECDISVTSTTMSGYELTTLVYGYTNLYKLQISVIAFDPDMKGTYFHTTLFDNNSDRSTVY